jgi:hypothetical protein
MRIIPISQQDLIQNMLTSFSWPFSDFIVRMNLKAPEWDSRLCSALFASTGAKFGLKQSPARERRFVSLSA